MIVDILTRVKLMPPVLRYAATMGLGLGIVFTVVPFIPLGTYQVSDTQFSWHELWETRVALAFVVLGVLLLAIGIGLVWKGVWVRPSLIALPILLLLPFLVVHWVFKAPNPVPSIGPFVILSVVWGILAAFYLFRTVSARAYFDGEA